MAVDYGTFVGNGMLAQFKSNADNADELPRWTLPVNSVEAYFERRKAGVSSGSLESEPQDPAFLGTEGDGAQPRSARCKRFRVKKHRSNRAIYLPGDSVPSDSVQTTAGPAPTAPSTNGPAAQSSTADTKTTQIAELQARLRSLEATIAQQHGRAPGQVRNNTGSAAPRGWEPFTPPCSPLPFFDFPFRQSWADSSEHGGYADIPTPPWTAEPASMPDLDRRSCRSDSTIPVLQSHDACESPELAFQLLDVQTSEAADDNSSFSHQDLPCIQGIMQSFLGDTLLAARISGSDIVFIGSVEDWQTMSETLGNDALLAIRPVTPEALSGNTVSELLPLRDNDPHALMHWTDRAPTEVTDAIMIWLEVLQFTTESRISGAVTIDHGDFTMEDAEHVLMNGTEVDTCLLKSYIMWQVHVRCMQKRVLDKQVPLLMKQLGIPFPSFPANDTADAPPEEGLSDPGNPMDDQVSLPLGRYGGLSRLQWHASRAGADADSRDATMQP